MELTALIFCLVLAKAILLLNDLISTKKVQGNFMIIDALFM
jgi:hypothetical protein